MAKHRPSALAAQLLWPAIALLLLAGAPARPSALQNGTVLGAPACNGCPVNGSPFYSSYSVQNISSGDVTVEVSYVGTSGGAIRNDTMSVPPGQGVFRDSAGLPSGFNGSVVISSDGPIAAVVNMTSQPGGEGYGGAYAPVPPPDFFPVFPNHNGPIGIFDSLWIQNVGSAPTMVVTYIVLPTGVEGPGSLKTSLEPGQAGQHPGYELAPNQGTPVHVQSFPSSAPITTVTIYGGTQGDDLGFGPPNHVDSGRASKVVLALALQKLLDHTATPRIVQNTSPTPADVIVTPYKADGTPLPSQNVMLPSFGSGPFNSFDGSVVVSSNVPVTAMCQLVQVGLQRTASRAEELTTIIPAAAETARKKAIAFGAVSSGTSQVSVGVLNVTDARVKAKVIVRNGSGKKIFGRTLKIAAHATGFLKYSERARGTDLVAEVQVRGKGEIVAFLLRTDKASGDVTYYPGVVIR